MVLRRGLADGVVKLAEDLRGAGGAFPATASDATVQRHLKRALLSQEVYQVLVRQIEFQRTGEWRG